MTIGKFDHLDEGVFVKIVPVNARRWNPDKPERVLSWLDEAGVHYRVFDDGTLGLGTRESGEGIDRHKAKPGDWVLSDGKGGYYAHDRATLDTNYDEVPTPAGGADMSVHPAFDAAHRLAPQPASRYAAPEDWARHYTAMALAAWAEFRVTSGEGPLLSLVGTAATAAAVGILEKPDTLVSQLWDVTPEAGALQGEWEEYLTDTLDWLGINPADIHPSYEAGDFRSPSREVAS